MINDFIQLTLFNMFVTKPQVLRIKRSSIMAFYREKQYTDLYTEMHRFTVTETPEQIEELMHTSALPYIDQLARMSVD